MLRADAAAARVGTAAADVATHAFPDVGVGGAAWLAEKGRGERCGDELAASWTGEKRVLRFARDDRGCEGGDQRGGVGRADAAHMRPADDAMCIEHEHGMLAAHAEPFGDLSVRIEGGEEGDVQVVVGDGEGAPHGICGDVGSQAGG